MMLFYWAIFSVTLRQHFKGRLKHNSKIYFISAGVSLILVMSLKAVTVGTDTIRYLYEYQNAEFYLSKLVRNSERGYSYFNFIVNKMGLSFQVYISIISVFFVATISKLFYKYSNNIMMSYYLHVTVGLFAMSMTGLRQSLAISFTLIAFIHLMKNNRLLFFLFVFIGYTFHNSAVVFVSIYFLRNILLDRKKAIILYVLSVSLFFFRGWIANFIEFITPDRYTRYWFMRDAINVNPLVILVALAIPLAAIIFWPKEDEKSRSEKNIISVLFIISCINFIVYFFALEIILLERISLYFMIYNTVLIPNIISKIRSKNIRRIGWAAAIILPLIQFILTTPGGSLGVGEYNFFWE